MNIIFNGMISNLGNNGGTRTILISAEVLRSLGHKVEIAAYIDNFDWFKHKQPIDFIPRDVDVVINIAAVDYEITAQMPIKRKFAWWRGHENWTMSDQDLGNLYREPRVLNIVNSRGLQNKLKTEFDADSVVVYQGIDLDDWKYVGGRSYDKVRIGCLYQKKPTKRWVDFVRLAEILVKDEYEFVGFGDTMRDDYFLDEFISNPTHEELVNLYNSCHIWFAPTELEGLHNPTIEASLCGCLIVANDNPMNGMILDYAFDNETAMIYEARNIEQAAEKIKNPNWGLVPAMQDHLKTKIGTRFDNMKKMIKIFNDLGDSNTEEK